MWKESSMERGYDCQGESATVGRQRTPAISTLPSPSFSLPLPSPRSLAATFTYLVKVWTSLIDHACATRASAVWHDDPREHHVWNRPRRHFPRRGEIREAVTMANIHKFISSLPEWLQHTRGATRGAGCLVGRNKVLKSYVLLVVFLYFLSLFLIFDF